MDRLRRLPVPLIRPPRLQFLAGHRFLDQAAAIRRVMVWNALALFPHAIFGLFPGNANLLIGVRHGANREIGAPRLKKVSLAAQLCARTTITAIPTAAPPSTSHAEFIRKRRSSTRLASVRPAVNP